MTRSIRKALNAIALAGSSVALLAATVSAQNAHKLEAGASPCRSAASSSVIVDTRIVLGLTYVEGSINCSGPLHLVLDSGASYSIVTPQLAEKLHLKTEESTVTAGPGKGGDNLLHMIHNATLTLGATTITGQTIAALPIEYIEEEAGVPTDGLFGANFFSRFVVDEDYAAHAVRLLNPAAFTPPPGFISLPVFLGGDASFAQLTLEAPDGTKLSGIFLVDTGFVGDLGFTEPFVRAHPALLRGKRADLPAVSAVGGTFHIQMGRIQALTVGSFILREPVAAFPSNAAGVFANAQIAGILGNGVLKRFHVIFDWPHKQLLLAPNHDLSGRSPANCSGLALKVEPPEYHRLLVRGVIRGSPAETAGIRAGDVILAVKSGTAMPHPDPMLSLPSVVEELEAPGRTFSLLIERDRKIMQFTFVTRDLY